jgi:hypothetical protein
MQSRKGISVLAGGSDTEQRLIRRSSRALRGALLRGIPRSLLTGVIVACCWLAAALPTEYAESGWQVEVVADGGGDSAGIYSALAVDHNAAEHIAYYDSTDKALRYAFRRPGDKKWSLMSLGQESGTFVSLAVDSQGRPHMAFNTQRGLRYAYWDSQRWHTQIIDPIVTQFFTSIQLDAAGNPQVTYFELSQSHAEKGPLQKLKFAHFDGTSWYEETVEEQSKQEPYDSLAIDASGGPHIAYTEFERLKYTYRKGSQWAFEPVDPSSHDTVEAGLSIALDSGGNPHIAFFDVTAQTVNFVSREKETWKSEVVEKLSGKPGISDSVSLKMDRRDQPQLAYIDSGSGALKYAVRIDGKWLTEAVDQQGGIDSNPSLSLGSNDQPAISYYDQTHRQLRLVHRALQSSAPATGELGNSENGPSSVGAGSRGK